MRLFLGRPADLRMLGANNASLSLFALLELLMSYSEAVDGLIAIPAELKMGMIVALVIIKLYS
jgi:uncharacterized membrane protein